MKEIFTFLMENWVEIFAVISAVVAFVESLKHKGWKASANERDAMLETVITTIGFQKGDKDELKKQIEKEALRRGLKSC